MLCQFLLYSKVNQLYIYSLFSKILFRYMPLQSTKQSFLCYIGPYQLSILHIAVCLCQSQSLNLSLPSPSFPPWASIRKWHVCTYKFTSSLRWNSHQTLSDEGFPICLFPQAKLSSSTTYIYKLGSLAQITKENSREETDGDSLLSHVMMMRDDTRMTNILSNTLGKIFNICAWKQK